MKIVILAGGPALAYDTLIPDDTGRDTYFIGVDRGAYRLMTAGFPLHLAIGDFDSLSDQAFAEVASYALEVRRAPAEKDDTDLELALMAVKDRWAEAQEIIILGGLGGRFDHEIQIFYLILQARFADLVDKIRLVDRQNVIRFVSAGSHLIRKRAGMTYLAFASLTPVRDFSINNAKYSLESTNFPSNFSLSSNEFVADQPVSLAFTQGIVAIIQSKDDLPI
ncbi:MAG: thiamine diphosphokinase [Streptococcaceae bacterium]|nr:thiamine diphosphokinase [Streptococcaceae bacterium]